MKIALVMVPFFLSALHRRWAEAAVQSIASSTHELYSIAVVNATRPGSDDRVWLGQHFNEVVDNTENCLARAWNVAIRRGLAAGARYVILANTDVVFHPRCIDSLVAFAERRPELLLWSGTPWHNCRTLDRAYLVPEEHRRSGPSDLQWGCVMLDQRLPREIGFFDERFVPAYLEDADIRYRIALAGHLVGRSEASVFFHRDRGTLRGIPDSEQFSMAEKVEVLSRLRQAITENDQRYGRKWGGAPGRERFLIPYNGALEEGVRQV